MKMSLKNIIVKMEVFNMLKFLGVMTIGGRTAITL